MIVHDGKTIGLLDEKEACQYLNVCRSTLLGFRASGLRFAKLGDRQIRYRIEDLDDFVRARVGAASGKSQ